MVNLYAVAPIKTIEAGEELTHGSAAARVIYLVIKGSLEFTSLVGGARVRTAVISTGECIEAGETAVLRRDSVTAREPSTVMEIGSSVLELLPPTTQIALYRGAAASASARFDMLLSRHADVAATNAHLASAVIAVDDRSRACLASPSLQPLIAEIPRLPVYAAEIALKLLDERTRADEVVESIKNDPALAALVLKRVNSAHYALETRISDYYHAFLMLGVNNVYQIILESGIESVMPDTDEAREIQTCAHLVSVLSREIAALSTDVPAVVAATIGLLHNVGRSVALIINRARPEIGALVSALDPSALGGRVLQSWGLPERVVKVISDQRHAEVLPPTRLGHEYAREAAVLHLAHVCHDLLAGRAPRSPYAQEYLELIGLRGTSPAGLYRERIAPALWKMRDCLPAGVRTRLEAQPASSAARTA
jgi:HD-like signal output (HDOD) protein